MVWIGKSGVITGTIPDITLVAVTTPLAMVVVVGAVVVTPLAMVVVGTVVVTPLAMVVVGSVVATPLAMVVVGALVATPLAVVVVGAVVTTPVVVVVVVALVAVHVWGGTRSGRGHSVSSHVKGVCFLSLQEIKSIMISYVQIKFLLCKMYTVLSYGELLFMLGDHIKRPLHGRSSYKYS